MSCLVWVLIVCPCEIQEQTYSSVLVQQLQCIHFELPQQHNEDIDYQRFFLHKWVNVVPRMMFDDVFNQIVPMLTCIISIEQDVNDTA